MIIYKAEASIAEQITKSTVLAYTMPLVKWEPDTEVQKQLCFDDKTLAGERDNDLYYTKSIFVTTNWNKNDDVFDKVETWAARHTPTHKPTNVEHNEKKLVGHITNCWAMTTDSQVIPDNTIVDDLPNIYHLVNGAVIYRGWRNDELASMAKNLIEQIEKGEKFVSMECMFTDFNYAILNSEGKCDIIPRNENSAWMTKHLRVYGGTGEYDGYKIGRILRNITFSGKGYVDRPANPDSIIFNNANLFDFKSVGMIKENPFILNNGVYFNEALTHKNEEINTMSSELDILKTQLDEVKASLKEALDTKVSLEEKLAKVDNEKSESHIVELEKALADSKLEIESGKKTLTDLQDKMTIADKTIADINVKNEELTKKLSDMTQAQIISNRITNLVEGGIEREVAEKKVALYTNLTDEQWTDLASELVEAAKKKTIAPEDKTKMEDEKKTDCKADEDTHEDHADTKILDNAKVNEELNLSIAGNSEKDDLVELRKELQQALASRLNIDIDNEEKTNE